MECGFDIVAWQVASDRIVGAEQWQAWAQGWLDTADLPPVKADLAHVPPLQRRRLGASARLLFQAAGSWVQTLAPCPLVWLSYDGEINRSVDLWQTLLRGEGVSPTSFGLSVHNAAAGQWSMLRGDRSEQTALAAAGAPIETAVVEAVGLLADGAEQVLVAVSDEPLRAAAEPVVRAPFAYAVVLLIRPGRQWTLRRVVADALPQTGDGGALAWLRQMLTGAREWTLHYPHGGAWQWTHHG